MGEGWDEDSKNTRESNPNLGKSKKKKSKN
jgi:hypothetical protein